MDDTRFKLVYRILLPAIGVATCVLGYFSYLTASQFQRLGEKSLAESSLWLAKDRVNRLEETIIAGDNQVFGAMNLETPENALADWKLHAEEISPSVRAAVVLDVQRRVVDASARATERDTQQFMRLFLRQIVPDMKLESLPYNVLNHLHKTYDGKSYLLSFKAVRQHGRRFYLAAHHDTGYLIRTVFPRLFRSESGREWHNVVDEDNRRVFGPNLSSAGDYVVGLRFPTTLYAWRLQVAPKTAPLLKATGRSSRFNQAALIGLSLGVILIAVGFILYAADKERRLARLKSDFIANVSHELKTPLSVIRMFGEMLLTKRVRDANKRQEYLEIICSESERLSGLIENVLDFAALERGKSTYDMQPSELSALVARAVETFRHRLERGGATVHVHVHGEPPHANVDAQAIMLAIINLLDNAVKYAGSTTPAEVTLETRGEQVEIRVRDHGPGIPPNDLKRVFERFYRSQIPNGIKTRGSGIGLSLVKHIAEAHGGRAWAENASDGGAIVAFSLPRRDPVPRTSTAHPTLRAQLTAQSALISWPDMASTSGRTILLVEDDPALALGLRDTLEFEGFRVLHTDRGAEGLQLAAQAMPDCIILDLMLPDMNGYQICEHLRRADSAVPIIMLTARGQEADKIRGLDAGADDYVTKPFSVGELIARIRAMFRRGARTASAGPRFMIGDAVVDVAAHTLTRAAETIAITFYEVELLKLLHERVGQPVSRDEILDKVWGTKSNPTNRTVDNFVVKLRKKLEPNLDKPRHILTVYGFGYKLVP